MEVIVYRTDSDWGAVRFVKGTRWTLFGKKVVYTTDMREAKVMAPEDIKQLPENDVRIDTIEAFVQRYADRGFFVIEGHRGRHRGYYAGVGRKGEMQFTPELHNADIYLSRRLAEETLAVVRQDKKVRAYCHVVYLLDLQNELTQPNMVIVCQEKGARKKLYYFKGLDSGQSRVDVTSRYAEAEFMNYEQATTMFELLHKLSRQYAYAVMQKPKEPVDTRGLKSYLQRTGTPRSIVGVIRLRNLKIKEHAEEEENPQTKGDGSPREEGA